MRFKVGFATDIGLKRQQNQDSGGAYTESGFFLVADGMGGHKGGETASSMVKEITPALIESALKKHTDTQTSELKPRQLLAETIQVANNAIFDRSTREANLHGMGTTTTALLFTDKTMAIGHVGDSRCYFFRPGSMWQLTRDHSLVQEKLRSGLITREQIKTDTMKNVITRSVGFEKHVSIDTYEMAIHPNDVFLICSDGLTGMVEEPTILDAITRCVYNDNDAQKAADLLIETANQNGGEDNVTVVVVKILESELSNG